MKKIQQTQQNLSLIWGSMRNLIDFNELTFPETFGIVGEELGIFPIDSFNDIYLEIPKNDKKMNLSGRKNVYFGSPESRQNWKQRRIIQLPIYIERDSVSVHDIQEIADSWNDHYIPEDIPCVAVSSVINGERSSDGRLAQYACVLIIYPNKTARVLELDWFEGPLDDCITPEWYIRTSELMSANLAIEKVIGLHTKPTNLGNPQFRISSIPTNLNINYRGKRRENNSNSWKSELTYFDFEDFQFDLQRTLTQLRGLSRMEDL